tara:strand:- start:848 stop:1057 length:210 start_codon:yes stop_codon:yes gene_type:complete
MNHFILLALITTLLFPTPSQAETNHFNTATVFELDLGDSEKPLTPKQEKEQKLLKNSKEEREVTLFLIN